jgi:hypothetical protein
VHGERGGNNRRGAKAKASHDDAGPQRVFDRGPHYRSVSPGLSMWTGRSFLL